MKQSILCLDRDFRLAPLDRKVFGSFIEHLGRAVYGGIYQPDSPLADEQGFRRDVLALVRQLGVPVVRYPGGNFVSGYHWRDGVGPRAQRPPRAELAWRVIEPNEFGVDEFADWAKKAGAEPLMAVNLGTGTAEEARDLVEYCNFAGGTVLSDLRRQNGHEAAHDIRLWCLGNEMDGPWQMGHKTAEEYGRAAAETGRLMKMADPSIKLVACGSSSPAMPTFGSWEDTVLSLCYDQADYLSLHQYFGNREDNTPDFLACTLEMDRFIRSVTAICDCAKVKQRKKKDMLLSFDEWNVWYHSNEADRKLKPWGRHPHQLEDVYNFEDALLVGGLLITLIRHADRVRLACLAQLVNVIAPICTSDTGAWRQTTFYPFEMASRDAHGTVLELRVVSDAYESSFGDAPYVEAAAVLDEEAGSLCLLLLNRDLNEPREAVCDVRQFEGCEVARHTVLSHPDLKAADTEADPLRVVPHTGLGARIENGRLSAVLEPKSFTSLVLRLPRR